MVEVAGEAFLAVRLLGLAERVALTLALFVLFARLSRPVVALLATVLTVVLFASTAQDVIDSYLQVCLFLGLLGVYFLIRGLESVATGRAAPWVLAAGSAQALAFLTKQTTGLAVALVSIVLFVVAVRAAGVGRKAVLAAFYLVGWVLPAAAVLTWLAAEGATGAYVSQVYVGAAGSKGSLVTLMSRALFSQSIAGELTGAALLGACGVAWYAGCRWIALAEAGPTRPARMRVIVLCFVAGGLLVWNWVLDPRYRSLVVGLIIAGGLAQSVVVLLRRRSEVARLRHWSRGPAAVIVAAVGCLALLLAPLIAGRELWWRFLSLHFYDLKVQFVVWSSFAAAGLLGYWVWRLLKRRDALRAATWAMLAAVGVAVVATHAMSYTVEVHAAAPVVGVVVIALVRWRLPGRPARLAALGVLVSVTLVLCSAQRYVWPYSWWGWQEPSVEYANVAPETPLLAGFRLSEETARTYATVDRLVRVGVHDGGWVYCFPNVTMFYVSSGVYPHTKALVGYWDVCPDDLARGDADVLLSDPPSVIVDLEMEEVVWQFHEEAFRAGRQSGQRDIAAAIGTLTSSGRYRRAFSTPTIDGTLVVWVRGTAE